MAQAMEMDIQEYMTSEGRVPFREWLENLRDRAARARIRIRLDRMRLGNPGDCRSLNNGIYELRVAYGPGYRIYFAWLNRTVVLLLAGGDKNSQHVDIDRATTYWNDFRARQT